MVANIDFRREDISLIEEKKFTDFQTEKWKIIVRRRIRLTRNPVDFITFRLPRYFAQ